MTVSALGILAVVFEPGIIFPFVLPFLLLPLVGVVSGAAAVGYHLKQSLAGSPRRNAAWMFFFGTSTLLLSIVVSYWKYDLVSFFPVLRDFIR